MNRSDFQNEMFEYIDLEYKKYCKYQNIVNEIYSVVFQIAKSNSIPLYISYGSLLGVIRDGTFLPWDSDIDTMVLYKDVNKLIELLNKELPNKYFFATNIKNSKYSGLMLRIGRKGYNLDAIHVDVFYGIYASNVDKNRKKQIYLAKVLFDLQFQKYYVYNKASFNSIKKYYYARICTIKAKLVPGIIIKMLFRNLVNQYDNTNYILIIAGDATKVLKSEDIFPGSELELSTGSYLIFENYKSILKEMYGQYENYTDISERFKEFYTRIRYLEREGKI